MTPKDSAKSLEILTQRLRNKLLIAAMSDVKIRDVDSLINAVKGKAGSVEVQLFDADRVAGRRHLEFAALNAVKAFQDGYNISRSLPVEVMLYASAQRQIGKAFTIVGVNPKTRNMAVLIIADKREEAQNLLEFIRKAVKGTLNDKAMHVDSEEKLRSLMRLFNVSSQELRTRKKVAASNHDALVDLIVERIAILATQR